MPDTNLLADYTFKKDALFAGINLRGDELDTYYEVHNALAEKIPLPDLIVYLRASTDVLMQRITHRDRPYERDMERSYIEEVNQAYEKFFGQNYVGPPILIIDTDALNYIANINELKWVEERIRQTLKMSPLQAELL